MNLYCYKHAWIGSRNFISLRRIFPRQSPFKTEQGPFAYQNAIPTIGTPLGKTTAGSPNYNPRQKNFQTIPQRKCKRREAKS